MAQTQRAQGPSDPEATGGGMSEVPEMWGNGGLVGDGSHFAPPVEAACRTLLTMLW